MNNRAGWVVSWVGWVAASLVMQKNAIGELEILTEARFLSVSEESRLGRKARSSDSELEALPLDGVAER
jgi:hypothetical protein